MTFDEWLATVPEDAWNDPEKLARMAWDARGVKPNAVTDYFQATPLELTRDAGPSPFAGRKTRRTE